MKRIFYMLCFAIAMQGCQSEPNYKAVREEVITLHDELMANEDKAMNAKMALDTIGPKQHDSKTRDEIAALSTRLGYLSDEMSKWMQNFKPDISDQSNTQAVAYFEREKVKVKALDSLYKATLTQAEKYMQQFNVKADTTAHQHKHSMHM